MRFQLILLAMTAGIVSVQCSTTHYREAADREVYNIVENRTVEVPGMVEDFTIEPPLPAELEHLPVNDVYVEELGVEAEGEVGARILSLEDALYIAFNYSREYQNAKESLYLQALSLTLDRHRFTPIFSAGASVDYARTTRDQVSPNALGTFLASAPGLASDLQQLTGTPAVLLQQYAEAVGAAGVLVGANTTQLEVVNERSVSADTSVGVSVLTKMGGRIALNLTSNFFRFLTGDPREAASSALIGSFTQPLLRGAGRDVAAEFLTQAERDLLYQMRDFTRFRKIFAVRIASAYYGVLNNRDAARNSYVGLQSARRNLARQEAMAEEGRIPQGDLGRVRQQALNFEASWIGTVRNYKRALDDFKILIGLSSTAALILDEGELERLLEQGLLHPNISIDDAVVIALATRLDLYTRWDEVADSERRVKVAANNLLPDVDFVATGRIDSQDGNRPLSPDFDRARWSAGFDVDFGLDRKAERNSYRSALIAYERTLRNSELFEDQIRLDVRDALRGLEQQRSNFQIAEIGVALNERRVEEQLLLTEVGRGSTIDLVDAENDLLAARNSLTNALVSHTIARLAFFRDLGILHIKDNGQWEELTDGSGPQIEEADPIHREVDPGVDSGAGVGGGDLRLSPE